MKKNNPSEFNDISLDNLIKQKYPETSLQAVTEYSEGLPQRFFDEHSQEQQAYFCHLLSKIDSLHFFSIIPHFNSRKKGSLTILTYDYPYSLSLFVGIIASLDFDIQSASFFSYLTKVSVSKESRNYRKLKNVYGKSIKQMTRKKIIYTFEGNIPKNLSLEIWQQSLRARLNEVIRLLEESTKETNLLLVRQRVNQWVSEKITKLKKKTSILTHPTLISTSDHDDCTEFIIETVDTPFFLYALTLSLNYIRLNIVSINIKTESTTIKDRIYIVDSSGNKLTNQTDIDRVKLIIILLKQFTYFSDNSPNPFQSITRFIDLITTVLSKSDQSLWITMLSENGNMKKLSRILGASDFIWEDFIRIQTESLLPILNPRTTFEIEKLTIESFHIELNKLLKNASTFEEKMIQINRFKNDWTTYIDLHHILKQLNFREFSKCLSNLAEVIITKSCKIIEKRLRHTYGLPKTFAGFNAIYTIVGLGKFGGTALGYASDIELMLIYSDDGSTSGDKSISNTNYFNQFVEMLSKFIQTKRDGIFSIDLRLRPYGVNGPKGVSVASLCNYYSSEGDAHIYERLALVRLRYICGSVPLGQKINRFRNEWVYSHNVPNFKTLLELRVKQVAEKLGKKKQINAKYSPGALVDIEYTVQALQMKHGFKYKKLQTPSVHDALEELGKSGIISITKASQIIDAYQFFRRLINGLRMLRGSAKDLTMPAFDSHECTVLAKRVGYTFKSIKERKQLSIDYETHSSIIRTFIDSYLNANFQANEGRSVADIMLSSNLTETIKLKILTKYGFKNPETALINLHKVTQSTSTEDVTLKLLVYAFDKLSQTPDPDRALNNWERFMENCESPSNQFHSFFSELKQLDVLFDLFSTSQFLSDTLIKNPEIFKSVTQKKTIHKPLRRGLIYQEIQRLKSKNWIDDVRRFRRHEIMRIAIKDICFEVSLETVTRELSYLAEGLIQSALELAWNTIENDLNKTKLTHLKDLKDNFCILAFGKLGGTELNYSSDIDLVAIHSMSATSLSSSEIINIYQDLLSCFHKLLTQHTVEGFIYRVDFNLRPYGKLGNLVTGTDEIKKYYIGEARLWELQALLKSRPVAGNWWVGYDFLYDLRKSCFISFKKEAVIDSIKKNRAIQLKQLSLKKTLSTDIKNGKNGIRDIEFLIQGLQLIHLSKHPTLFQAKTLVGLKILRRHKLIGIETHDSLKNAYILFRRVEHFLQILEDRQTHVIPKDNDELKILAKKTLGSHATFEELNLNIRVYKEKVDYIVTKYFNV
ncbi:hypothetical protein HOG98_03145 [bacterium]|jgi:[glutamine synthetase] adenylyltransferase / [glutamine synthetase]-adenylyl-L-tyrosine phosphorylase|nr:hypothetical protein [bacterium]